MRREELDGGPVEEQPDDAGSVRYMHAPTFEPARVHRLERIRRVLQAVQQPMTFTDEHYFDLEWAIADISKEIINQLTPADLRVIRPDVPYSVAINETRRTA